MDAFTRHCHGTLAEWLEYDPVLAKGEIALVATDPDSPDEYNSKKVGDGVRKFSQLPMLGFDCLQSTGSSTLFPMSQDATTKAIEQGIQNSFEEKIIQELTDDEDKIPSAAAIKGTITSEITDDEDKVPSNKAVMDRFKQYSGAVYVDKDSYYGFVSGEDYPYPSSKYHQNSSQLYDCGWFFIRKGVEKIKVTNAICYDYIFFNSIEPSTESIISRILSNTSLPIDVPEDAKLCLLNLRREYQTSEDYAYFITVDTYPKIEEVVDKEILNVKKNTYYSPISFEVGDLTGYLVPTINLEVGKKYLLYIFVDESSQSYMDSQPSFIMDVRTLNETAAFENYNDILLQLALRDVKTDKFYTVEFVFDGSPYLRVCLGQTFNTISFGVIDINLRNDYLSDKILERSTNEPMIEVKVYSKAFIDGRTGIVTALTENYQYTDYLPITPFIEYFYSGRGKNNAACWCFYDHNKKFISADRNCIIEEDDYIYTNYRLIDIPNNAKYVRFGTAISGTRPSARYFLRVCLLLN